MHIKALILSFLFFGAFSVQASYTEIYPASSKLVTADLNFVIYCNDNISINKIYQRYGGQTSGTVFDLITPTETVRATTTSTSGVLEFSFTNLKCSQSQNISATLDFISGDSAWNWYRLSNTPYGILVPYNSMMIYADASEPTYWFAQGYDFNFNHVIIASSSGTSSSMSATTTIISQNDNLITFGLFFAIFLMSFFFGFLIFKSLFHDRK